MKPEPPNKPSAPRGIGQDVSRNSLNATITAVDVVDFAVARAVELKALRDASASVSSNRRVYQQLSWHSRRRTMSHSSHRMPVRLKAAHIRQLKQQRATGEPEKKPGPKGSARLRKYRKKARFLLSIRKLRAANPTWLETHIWHAKRFKMEIIGGKKVAIRCNDRGYRSCFKAAAHASVIHDSSYLEIIEVTAAAKCTLKSLLKSVLAFEDGRRATTDPAMSGCRKVQNLVLTDPNGKAVAPCDMLWRPTESAQLWLWILPEVKCVVKELLLAVASNENDDTINVNCISNAPLCFSIIGPRSGAVLGAVLQSPEGCRNGIDFITQSRSPDCLPKSCTLSGQTADPRASFPPKTMRMQISSTRVFSDSSDIFRTTSDNDLWQSARREHFKEVILGGANGLAKGSLIPFMLLHRADGMRRGFGSGWDLIVPAGWGMAFWVSLIYANSARAIGREEMRLLKLEGGLQIFPEDFLDTVCGDEALRREEGLLLDKYRRRPKSKRVNYAIYRIKSPMFPALKEVALQELSRSNMTVKSSPPQKRPRSMQSGATSMEPGSTQDVDKSIQIVRSQQKLELFLGKFIQLKRYGRHRTCITRDNICMDPQEECFSLLRVELIAYGKGVPLKNAIICAGKGNETNQMREKKSTWKAVHEHRGRLFSEDVEPSRDVIGYVTTGGFNLTRGLGRGFGVVTVSAVKRLLENDVTAKAGPTSRRGELGLPGIYVLFRNVNSLYYRIGILRVLT